MLRHNCPMLDMHRHKTVRCGTRSVTRLSDVGHGPSQDCPMWDTFRHKTVRCGTRSVTRLSDVGHVPSQDCPMWDMFRNGLLPPTDTCPSQTHDSLFAHRRRVCRNRIATANKSQTKADSSSAPAELTP